MAEVPAPTFQIPRDVIEPIISASVATAVANALGQQTLLRDCIARVLTTKVDSSGKPGQYNSDRNFLDWVLQDVLVRTVKVVLEEEVAKHKDAIRKALVSSLQQKNSPLVKQLVDGMLSAVTNPELLKYRIKVEYDGK